MQYIITKNAGWIINLLGLTCAVLAAPVIALANGFGESAPWQFPSVGQQGVNIATVDLIERKKGGYYDGFTNTIYSSTITNIGTQINCDIGANAIGNTAQNSQGGNNALVDATATITPTSVGNDALAAAENGESVINTTQNASGTQNSDVSNSSVDTSTGSIVNGGTSNDLVNDQQNSGNQTADVTDSLACDMNGSSLTGNIGGNFSGQQLNAPLN